MFIKDNSDELINLIDQFERLEISQASPYIKDHLVCSLDKNYQNAKDYFKNSSKNRIYSIRKALVDLADNREPIPLFRQSEEEAQESFSKYKTLFSISNCLKLIYYFALIYKNKTDRTQDNAEILQKLTRIIKDIKILEEDIQNLAELNRPIVI